MFITSWISGKWVQRSNKTFFPKSMTMRHLKLECYQVVDYEKGRLNIAILEPKGTKKVTNISIDLNAVHPLEKYDLHRQTEK
jgi:hypothetical protein